MSRTEAAWLAGLIDGEGTIGRYRTTNGHGGVFQASIISVVNTHRGALDRCVSITGVGTITPKTLSSIGKTPMFGWKISTTRDVVFVLRQIIPFLVIKKERAAEVLKAME